MWDGEVEVRLQILGPQLEDDETQLMGGHLHAQAMLNGHVPRVPSIDGKTRPSPQTTEIRPRPSTDRDWLVR